MRKSDYGGYIFDTLVLVVLLEVRFGTVQLKRGALRLISGTVPKYLTFNLLNVLSPHDPRHCILLIKMSLDRVKVSVKII